MEPYIFYGKILPERAQITLGFGLNFTHLVSSNIGIANVSIVLNQLAVTVQTKIEWNIFDLRNVVNNIVQSHLAMIGYLNGYAYDLEITRVLNSELKIDYVFGIDIPAISKPREGVDLASELEKLRMKSQGENGIFLNRCFKDLVSAMKDADDTGFYCYRAVEALRHHCAVVHNISEKDKKAQWEKFRSVSNTNEEKIRKLEGSAKSVRHGGVSGVTSHDRADLFKTTWDIVGAYISNI
jgi:hypothetical protein